MERYYFLFAIAFLWTAFAVVQDLRKREVSNWLNYSFLLSALAYRVFYSLLQKDYWFLLWGILGLVFFYVFSTLFYYGGAFGGGDARLLRAYGLVMPFESWPVLVMGSLGFVLLLFFSGAVFTLICSIFLVNKNWSKFKKESFAIWKKHKLLALASIAIGIALFLAYFGEGGFLAYFALLIFTAIPLLYIYLKAVENSCMIVLTSAKDLTEGDWITGDIKAGRKTIKKTVHGLSFEDIEILRKANKKIFVRHGIPFVPAFLIALVTMVFFFLALGPDFYLLQALLF